MLLGERIKAKNMGVRSEGLCRPYLGEGSVNGVSVLQHWEKRGKDAEGKVWVR